MTTLGDEKEAVQNPLIEYATHIGWEYIPPKDAVCLRGGRTGLIFKDLFSNQMQKLNPKFMDNILAEEIIKKLEHISPTKEGNFTAWQYLNGVRTIFVPYQKRDRNITFIDTQTIDNNVYHVTDEFTYSNKRKTIRPDIVFLINGFPILFIETKAAKKIDGISVALDQIKGYHRKCPELLALLQVYALTHIIQYYYSATWNTTEQFLFNWKEETEGDFETLVKTFLDRKRIVKLLTDFILFTREDDELKKVVLRPHQMRAVNKIVQRVKTPVKKRGLIWHTQGSGKTYTMVVAAQKIIENPLFENPTVIMLVDRTELESQLFANLRAVGIENMRVTKSKRHLRTLLRQDTRGLIVTMIHKFEDMPENINTRKNIFVLVDEAHRTTGGKLGNFLVGALPNATYLGFTGTPIDKTSYGRGTFIIFGKDDPPHGYLDKYSIAESIEEGTTVPLRYTLAPSELQVEREILDKEFLDLKETEGICDFDTLKKALEKAVNLRNMLKNEERITKTSRYIADHYKKYVEPLGYKAFVVAVDREACYLYKKALDNYLPKEYTTPVFSQYHGDPLDMAQYHLTKKEEKRVRKAFKNPDKQPKILIVTQKLLTGFDAPILYCMYLDKPMRDHVLLQAIARVNRPYEDEAGRKKSSGFVLDFVGIFDRLEKALAFDSRDIEGVVEDIEELKKRFSVLIEDAREEYLSLVEGKKRDKAVEGVLKHFLDEEKRHKYYQFFKEVSDIYDIISPDAFLRQYLEDFEQLTSIYRMLKEGYEGSVSIDKEFSEKTAQLVREHTKSGSIGLALEIFEINEKTLKKIEESHASDTEKVISLIQTIERLVREYGEKKPYLISIGERAEEVIKRYKQRQKTTQQTLEDIKGIITEINEAKIEEKQKKLSTDGFSIYWELKQKGIALPEENAAHIEEILQKFPYWRTSERHSRKVKQNLYNMLLKTGVGDISEVTDIAQSIMRMLKGGEE